MSWKDNAATRAVKKYALATTVFVASVFGGGAKAAAAERDDAPADKIEVVEATQQQNQERKSKRTYTFTRAELPQSQSRQSSQNTSTRQTTRTSQSTSQATQTARTQQMNTTTQTKTQTQQKKNKSPVAQAVKDRMEYTKKAFKSAVDYELTNWKTEGARQIKALHNDLIRHRSYAHASAEAKQQEDQRYADNFEVMVTNALIFKYQVDHGHGLREYIPYETRKNIMNKAKAHGKNVYKLLRRDANEDLIMDYMGRALEGVECTPKQKLYEYHGEKATIHENLAKTMGVKSNNYTIGGRQYSR